MKYGVIITNDDCEFSDFYYYDFNKKEFIKLEEDYIANHIKFVRSVNVRSSDIYTIDGLTLHGMHLTTHIGKLKDVNTIVKMIKNGELDYRLEHSGEGVMYVYSFDDSYMYNIYNTFVKIGGLMVNLIDLKTLMTMKLTSRFAEFISEELSGTLELEYEKTYLTMILVTKKRYYTLKHDGKIDVKGLEIVRRDWSEATKEMVRSAFNYLLTYNTHTAVKKIIELFDREVDRFKNYEFSLDEVTKTQKLSDDYKSENLPQVTASKILERMGFFVQPGMEISYIVLKNDNYVQMLQRKGIVKFPHRVGEKDYTRVIPVDIIGLSKELDWEVIKKHVDIDKVIEANIVKPLARVLVLFGYDESVLWKKINERNQSNLVSYLGKNNALLNEQSI